MLDVVFYIFAITVTCIVIIGHFIAIYTWGDINDKLPLDKQILLDEIKETPSKYINSKLVLFTPFERFTTNIQNNRDIRIALFDSFLVLMTTRANKAITISLNEIECFKKALLPKCYLLLYKNERYLLSLTKEDADYLKQMING